MKDGCGRAKPLISLGLVNRGCPWYGGSPSIFHSTWPPWPIRGVTTYIWSPSPTTSWSHMPVNYGNILMDIPSSGLTVSPVSLNGQFKIRITHHRVGGREGEEKDKEEKELEKADSLQREPDCGKRWRKGLRRWQQLSEGKRGRTWQRINAEAGCCPSNVLLSCWSSYTGSQI